MARCQGESYYSKREGFQLKKPKSERMKGKKKRVTTKECKLLREEFDAGGFMAQKGLWHIAKTRMLEDRGASLEEEGDLIREHQAMHEENLHSSWLREDEEGKVQKRKGFAVEPNEVNIRAGRDRLKEKRKRLSLTVKESVWKVCLNWL